MPDKVRWGILGAAKIARLKVVPAMQQSAICEIAAIASRDRNRAQAAAESLGIPKFYGSYEELIADPDIDAIYNPLPNHLHLPWTTLAAEAGKHVLCEKPIGMNASEARAMIGVRDRTGVKIMEAFMTRLHPQWLRTREILRGGSIGEPRAIHCVFSYNNRDPKNIRNIPAYGGGALMDIGCYPITMSRFLFGAEPLRVSAAIERDPEMGTDRLTSALLEFPGGHAAFTCSTQLAPYQRLFVFAEKGRIEVEIPVNAPPDEPTRIFVDGIEESFPVCDQYTVQGDAFSRAILDGTEVPVTLEDSLANMAVIDAVVRSAASGRYEMP
jgi:predicted dehydrogenase